MAHPDKWNGMIGLCRRAGHLIAGFDAAAEAVAAGRAALVLMADDLSEKTEKEWAFRMGGRTLPTVRVPLSKEQIGAAAGVYKPIGLAVVDDAGLADALRRLTEN